MTDLPPPIPPETSTELSSDQIETSRPPPFGADTIERPPSIPRASATGFDSAGEAFEQFKETASLVGKLSIQLREYHEEAQDERRTSAEERRSLRSYIAQRAQIDQANWDLVRAWMQKIDARLDGVDARLKEGDARFERIEKQNDTQNEQISKLRDVVTAMLIQYDKAAPQHRLAGLLVLLLDDDAMVRNALARVCEREGARVLHAGSVQAGVKAIDSHEVSVAAVDLTIESNGDGMAVVREIRANHPDIGVLIVTGGTTEAQDIEAAALGVNVLHKPFEAEQLVEAIRAARVS